MKFLKFAGFGEFRAVIPDNRDFSLQDLLGNRVKIL